MWSTGAEGARTTRKVPGALLHVDGLWGDPSPIPGAQPCQTLHFGSENNRTELWTVLLCSCETQTQPNKKMLTCSPTANHERQVDKCRVRRRRPETSHRACRRLQWSSSNRWVDRVALPEAAARLQVFYSGATHFILLWPTEVMVGMGFSPEEIKDSLLNQKYNEVTATYLLLGRKGDVSLVFLSHQLSHDGRGPSARRPRRRVSPSDWVLVSSNWTIFFPLQSDMLKCSHPSVFCHCLFRYIWG